MPKRSIVSVVLLCYFTLSIYHIYWWVKTKDEMEMHGARIPTAWLLIVPIVNIYWVWKWAEGVEYVTRGRSSAVGTFFLGFINIIGTAVIQSALNKVDDEPIQRRGRYYA